ncbi:amino acid--tRNA ligase-related protein [Dactylosporangium sp. NPDC049525]|uniref:amino acid--tRNA ligase-related protein n=1 Tax=Dactylosporangium sp. NPDC049525 TaxID=3154730 RepID=UPI00341561B6
MTTSVPAQAVPPGTGEDRYRIPPMMRHLRAPHIQDNLRTRDSIRQSLRRGLLADGFLEVDTPVAGPRLDEYRSGHIRTWDAFGQELWLAQSPQLYKQMLIAAGYRRYFQFAHCFRDEPLDQQRPDHLREFVQADIELEATDAAQVRRLVERLVAALCADLGLPCVTPFPQLDAVECVARYGTDRPDLRTHPDELAFVWVNDFPLAEADHDGGPRFVRHPMALPHHLPASPADALGVRTHSYDLVLNGYEIASGDLRIADADLQSAVLDLVGVDTRALRPLLAVLRSGCPPHGGLGMGLDRLAMQLTRSASVAEVTAFPAWSGYWDGGAR